MNKQQKIKNLTWRYFWEQKVAEVIKFLLITIIVIVAVFLVSLVGKTITPQGFTCASEFDCFFMGVFFGLLILFSLAVIIIILYRFFWVIFNWLKSNYRFKRGG